MNKEEGPAPRPGSAHARYLEVAHDFRGIANIAKMAKLVGVSGSTIRTILKDHGASPLQRLTCDMQEVLIDPDLTPPPFHLSMRCIETLLEMPLGWHAMRELASVTPTILQRLVETGLVEGSPTVRGAYRLTDLGRWTASGLGRRPRDADDEDQMRDVSHASQLTTRAGVRELILAMADELDGRHGLRLVHVLHALGNHDLPPNSQIDYIPLTLKRNGLLETIWHTRHTHVYRITEIGREWIRGRGWSTSGAVEIARMVDAAHRVKRGTGVLPGMPRLTLTGPNGSEVDPRLHVGLEPLDAMPPGTLLWTGPREKPLHERIRGREGLPPLPIHEEIEEEIEMTNQVIHRYVLGEAQEQPSNRDDVKALREHVSDELRATLTGALGGTGWSVRKVSANAREILRAKDREPVALSWLENVVYGRRIPSRDELEATYQVIGIEKGPEAAYLDLAPWLVSNSPVKTAQGPTSGSATEEAPPVEAVGREDAPEVEAPAADAPASERVAPAETVQSTTVPIADDGGVEAEPVATADTATVPASANEEPAPRAPAGDEVDAPASDAVEADGDPLLFDVLDLPPVGDQYRDENGRPFSQMIIEAAGNDADIMDRIAFSLENTVAALRMTAERIRAHRRTFGED
jgi:DNA-binding PadR family transcriptional regulator